jgi:hypothetical protein
LTNDVKIAIVLFMESVPHHDKQIPEHLLDDELFMTRVSGIEANVQAEYGGLWVLEEEVRALAETGDSDAQEELRVVKNILRTFEAEYGIRPPEVGERPAE